MFLVSISTSTIHSTSFSLLPRVVAELSSFSLQRVSLTFKPSEPFPLRLHHRTPLSPSPPLLPPPRASYDIPIRINYEEYERFLDSQPWKGAVVYKRDASVLHVEYSTSLDRLAIGWLSSRVSADRAAEMGLKLPADLNWNFNDENENNDDSHGGELNGDDVVLEGKDENDNSVFLSADELKNAKISVKYDNDDDPFDDDDDDGDDDEDELEEFVDTPVQLSIDVTRRRGRIRLDGILRTVITLDCNRCFEPAAECVYSNFSLLLNEAPIEEPPPNNLDSVEEMFDEAEAKKTTFEIKGAGGDEDRDIEWDDRLHFPAGEEEIDISKQVRDIIHLQITMNVVCSTNCKGVCMQCGSNLNLSNCTCVKVKGAEKSKGEIEKYGPLRDLRKKMEKSWDQ